MEMHWRWSLQLVFHSLIHPAFSNSFYSSERWILFGCRAGGATFVCDFQFGPRRTHTQMGRCVLLRAPNTQIDVVAAAIGFTQAGARKLDYDYGIRVNHPASTGALLRPLIARNFHFIRHAEHLLISINRPGRNFWRDKYINMHTVRDIRGLICIRIEPAAGKLRSI